MIWDDAAKLLALKALGTVESNLQYDSINMSDPLTVGCFQLSGTRAANLIQRIETEDPGSLDSLESSLLDDLHEYVVYRPSPIPMNLAYGNLKAHYMDDTEDFTPLPDRIDTMVAKINSMGDIFGAVEVNSDDDRGNPGQYILTHLQTLDSNWSFSLGAYANSLYYRSNLYEVINVKVVTISGDKRLIDYHMRQLATGYGFHYLLTHFISNQDGDNENIRVKEAKDCSDYAKNIPRSIIAGDFNTWDTTAGSPKYILKNRGGLIGLQKRTTPVNGDVGSLHGDGTGRWIDDILTKTKQTVVSAALVPTDGASDHYGFIKAIVDFDGEPSPDSDTVDFWNNRYLTSAEATSLKPVLFDHQQTQNQQMLQDFNNYMASAIALGMNPDDNTKAAIFFLIMYHQSPKNARRTLSVAGPKASLTRLYNNAMNNSVLSPYRTRYKTAKAIITGEDSSGVDLGGDVGEPTGEEPGGDPSYGDAEANTYVTLAGSQLFITSDLGNRFVATNTGGNYWIISGEDGSIDTPDDTGDPEPGDLGTSPGERVLAWVIAHIGDWKYSQGSGRLNPFESGYTDCSGCMWLAYKKVLGIDVGSWTGAQYKKGRLVTTKRSQIASGEGLLPGDLIFYHAYYSASHRFNHVEMYVDPTHTIGQVGSDAPGPNLHPTHRYLDWGKLDVMVRRYV